MTLTTTKFNAYMRERWLEPNAVMQAMMQNAPLLGMMAKKEDCGGRYTHIPILRVRPQGRSAVYATAKTNAIGSTAVGFDVTYANNYQIIKLTGDVIDDCKGDANAIFEALDHEVEGAIVNMKKDLQLQMFGNHGGARGQIGSMATTVLTLKYIEDAIHFEEGMELCHSTTDGTSGSVGSSGAAATVTAINRSEGKLTSDANWTTTWDDPAAADDYIFVEGDFGAKWAGMLSWIPASAPGATTFFGVNRSLDTDRLGGQRYTGTSEPIESAIINAAARAMLHDAQVTLGVLNPIKWAQLENSLGADRQNRITTITGGGKNATIGYKAIMLATPAGDVPIVSDPGCQKRYGLLLDMSTWKCLSVGPVVHIVNDDGLTIRRGTGDDWVGDLKSRGNFGCNAPGKNVRITLE